MAHPIKIKQEAVKLRKEGLSIPAIAKKLSIAKSTTSLWVRSVPLSEEIRSQLSENSMKANEKGREIMRIRRFLDRQKDAKEANNILALLQGSIDKNFWQLCAAILFWCEGSKRNLSVVGFINSDPQMIRVFLMAFRIAFVLEEKKFRIVIHLHNYHDEKKQKIFWSEVTQIPEEQFTKSYIKPNTQIRKREGYPGCISIKYFDARLAKKLDALYHAFAMKYGGLVKGL